MTMIKEMTLTTEQARALEKDGFIVRLVLILKNCSKDLYTVYAR